MRNVFMSTEKTVSYLLLWSDLRRDVSMAEGAEDAPLLLYGIHSVFAQNK